ncbi:unnamed protein product [Adineta steineri]|uniref:Uncharacterized protein n=1 Tax=Adineta steineri TaxID=433720 RepID=A0A814U142_9BILA|nr:unnamed protein product [Adineta steineri]
MICIQLCFFVQSTALYTYDIIIHQILPNLLIVIFSIALLLRVCRQKYRVGQSLQWRFHEVDELTQIVTDVISDRTLPCATDHP